MLDFNYVGLPCRVVFGAGKLATLKEEVMALGCTRVMVCCTPGRREEAEVLLAAIAPLGKGVCAIAEVFTPVYTVAEARKMAREMDADGLIAYGGGTAVGLAKTIALELEIPIIGVITTYSGSETTPLQGIKDGEKRTNYNSPLMLPKTLIYDPELTLDLPLSISIPSGFNSMAHAVGALFAADANPVANMFAEEGIRAISSALVRITTNPGDLDARGDALLGAWWCGNTLMMAYGVGLQHAICHVLGGVFGLPHASNHLIVLPHSVAYNSATKPEAARRLARALGDVDANPAGLMFDLLEKCGATNNLQDMGLTEDQLDRAVDLVVRPDDYYKAPPYDGAVVHGVLRDAWEGRRPSSEN
jgi:alcohol dehydrogenase class IV